jgi:hypothetical protein
VVNPSGDASSAAKTSLRGMEAAFSKKIPA